MQENSQTRLREEAVKLLAGGRVELVVGYGEGHGGEGVRPLLAAAAGEAQALLWNDACVHNLAVYLTREPCRGILLRGGSVAVVAKGCDARAIAVLAGEGQIPRERVHVIGMVCDGVRPGGGEVAPRCRGCEVAVPPVRDTLVGDPERVERHEGDPLEDARRLESLAPGERWEFWRSRLSRCIKCYACRQACPMCYCTVCITEKSRPQWIDRPSDLKGALAYHLIRAMHLAGRCVGCGECARACPVGIPVDMISRYLAGEVRDAFEYRAGMEPDAAPAFCAYREDDPGDFIR